VSCSLVQPESMRSMRSSRFQRYSGRKRRQETLLQARRVLSNCSLQLSIDAFIFIMDHLPGSTLNSKI